MEGGVTGDQHPGTGDAALLALAREGDREAFGRLVDRHKDALVGYLTALAGNRDRAEDLAQESFLRLYESRDRYAERGRLTGYLYRIALNLLRSQERQRKRRRFLRSMFFSANGQGADPRQQVRVLETELQRELRKAVADLPLHFRVPLVLHELAGWSYREIGELSGCKEGTVKSRIHRGRKLLRERLEPYWRGATG